MEPVITMTVLYWQYAVMVILSAMAISLIVGVISALICIGIGSEKFRREVFEESVDVMAQLTKIEEVSVRYKNTEWKLVEE